MTSGQRKHIYGLAREKGIDTDVLHALVWAMTRKEHLSELSSQEAMQVIGYLCGEDSHSNKPALELMTKKQRGMILHLAAKLGWVKDGGEAVDLLRLNGFVRKEYATVYFFNLSRSNACKCIECMKAMVQRVEKELSKKDSKMVL